MDADFLKFGTPNAFSLGQTSPRRESNMTHNPNTNKSSHSNARKDELPKDVLDLIQAVEHLPTEQRMMLKPVVDRVAENTKRRRRILSLVQEALSQLRLDMKYLVFDLEATRRERDAYRENLDDE